MMGLNEMKCDRWDGEERDGVGAATEAAVGSWVSGVCVALLLLVVRLHNGGVSDEAEDVA